MHQVYGAAVAMLFPEMGPDVRQLCAVTLAGTTSNVIEILSSVN